MNAAVATATASVVVPAVAELVEQAPWRWKMYAEEGVQIIKNLDPVKDAEVKVRRKKPVDVLATGRKLINEHFNHHLGFRGIILKMVDNGSIKEEQRRAAQYLVAQFLATLR